MRIRNVLPEFYKDDRLAELPPLARILYLGLHGLADRCGRLEDRPIRIKAEVLPYDEANVGELLCALAEAGCILRYATSAGRWIALPIFEAEQHINSYEKKTETRIPAPPIEVSSDQLPINFGSTSEVSQKPVATQSEALPRAAKHTSDFRPRIGDCGLGIGEIGDGFERREEALRKSERPGEPAASEGAPSASQPVAAPPPPEAAAKASVATAEALEAVDGLRQALALATAGRNLAGMTRRETRQVGLALAEIRGATPDVSADEIGRRARHYREHFRDAALTPMALASHCGRLRVCPRLRPENRWHGPTGRTENTGRHRDGAGGWRDRIGNALLGHIPDGAEWADIGPGLRERSCGIVSYTTTCRRSGTMEHWAAVPDPSGDS
jgi:hypothetical protein